MSPGRPKKAKTDPANPAAPLSPGKVANNPAEPQVPGKAANNSADPIVPANHTDTDGALDVKNKPFTPQELEDDDESGDIASLIN